MVTLLRMRKTQKQIAKTFNNNKGQILVEYLLLMVIAIAVATLLTKQLVSRNDQSPGMIIRQWHQIIRSIGNDVPDCANQKDFKKPSCPP